MSDVLQTIKSLNALVSLLKTLNNQTIPYLCVPQRTQALNDYLKTTNIYIIELKHTIENMFQHFVDTGSFKSINQATLKKYNHSTHQLSNALSSLLIYARQAEFKIEWPTESSIIEEHFGNLQALISPRANKYRKWTLAQIRKKYAPI